MSPSGLAYRQREARWMIARRIEKERFTRGWDPSEDVETDMIERDLRRLRRIDNMLPDELDVLSRTLAWEVAANFPPDVPTGPLHLVPAAIFLIRLIRVYERHSIWRTM